MSKFGSTDMVMELELLDLGESCPSYPLQGAETARSNLNTSYLPDPCWDNKLSTSPSSSTAIANTTMWNVSIAAHNPCSLLSSKLYPETVYKANVYQIKPKEASAPKSPYAITFFQSTGSSEGFFLVTDQENDRVGVFEQDMTYIGPLGKGFIHYHQPTSVLALREGGLLLLEKQKMHSFDERCLPIQQLEGIYHGLTEGENGEIFTISDNSIVKFVKYNDMYKLEVKIHLDVVDVDRKYFSKPRNLIYNMGNLHISDIGLHRLLLVDLSTGNQTASGYLGDGVGQFKRPAGMVADRDGNLLVLDQGNNRVLVHRESGKWVKVAASGPEGLEQPSGIIVWGDYVMVTFMGSDVRDGGLVKFSLEK